MCYIKRLHWACGCYFSAVPNRPCDKMGTRGCRPRHLPERMRLTISCQHHAANDPSDERLSELVDRMFRQMDESNRNTAAAAAADQNVTSDGAGGVSGNGNGNSITDSGGSGSSA
ncbi:hypothetical protein MFIFM68171_07121 [Madurella fahalii]|uniref:Uncharacterized protein n=1 Tax=Madurella fahalii TaxID=1157608 RepID=A0ABQ0GGM5_9PEZI